MSFNKFVQSKTFQIITWAIAGFIIIFIVFKLGILVGYKKASFSYRWGENYHRNFAGPRGGFFGDFISDKKDFIESHGVFGQVIKIDKESIIVKSRDNIEKTIIAGEKTSIVKFRKTVKLTDIKPDDHIVALGGPNDIGQIEAKLIRIMPTPTSLEKNTSSSSFKKSPSL